MVIYKLPTSANNLFLPLHIELFVIVFYTWIHPAVQLAKADMVHSVSGWTRGVQVKLWYPLRTRAIPERLRGVFTTRRYTNSRLPLPLPLPSVVQLYIVGLWRRMLMKARWRDVLSFQGPVMPTFIRLMEPLPRKLAPKPDEYISRYDK